MTFERTADLALVRSILTDPRCWRRMANDDAPEREKFDCSVVAWRCMFILARGGCGEPRALFVMVPTIPTEAEVHFCVVPSAWGRAVEIVTEFLRWAWRETSIVRLYGPVPGYNTLALATARRCGFSIIPAPQQRTVTKNGKTYPLILTSIERPTS